MNYETITQKVAGSAVPIERGVQTFYGWIVVAATFTVLFIAMESSSASAFSCTTSRLTLDEIGALSRCRTQCTYLCKAL
jgi:hypothetical protein